MSGEPLRGSLASLLRKLGGWRALRPVAAFGSVAALSSVALGASNALAASSVPANPSGARLAGRFLLAGHVTAAKGVRGVHAGQNVVRTWTFTAGCAVGACDVVTLVRQRTGGRDTIVLARLAPAYYGGAGSFYVPLRCGWRNYARGQRVPFTIRVRVSAAVLSAGTVYATRLEASYTNPSRTNLTPCVTAPAHVTAKYHGHLVTSASGAGAGPAWDRGGV